MEFESLTEYRSIYWLDTKEEDDHMLFHYTTKSCEFECLEFHSGLVLTHDRQYLYTCKSEDNYSVSKYKVNYETNTWDLVQELSRAENDIHEIILQLKLDKKEEILLGTTSNGFIVWDFNDRNKLSDFAIELMLPHGVRNISTKMLVSNSIMLSAHKDYAVAGVRKLLYVWSLESTSLVKILDAHFGRIIQLEPLTIGHWNSIITSSIDRSVKVWNINNIFEQVHVIDRHELQIDTISLSNEGNLAVTVTRGNVGVWDLKTGQLLTKLADNTLGAIVTHALITPDSKYIISAESGNILIWNRLTEQVLHKEQQMNIKQLILMNNEHCVLAASRPNNMEGVDVNRSNTTVVIRSIPDGKTMFTFEYPTRCVTGVPFKQLVQTSDGLHLVCVGADKNNKDCIYVFHANNGSQIHKFGLKSGMKDVISLVAMPNKGSWVGVILPDKGAVFDVKSKKYIRSVPKWCGSCTSDSKYGLYAPSRGGLELIELKKGATVKTFIPKVAEGVFTIICLFNSTDEYVLYYHSGRKTVRVFRTEDTKMIANYRVQAELTAIKSTVDGRAVVLGTVDGCLSVLAIADPQKSDMIEYLRILPSRDEEWKRNLEKLRAQRKFKAAASVAQLTKSWHNANIVPASQLLDEDE